MIILPVIMEAVFGITRKLGDTFVIGNLVDVSIIRTKQIAQFVDIQIIFQIKVHTAKCMNIGGVSGNIQGSRIAAIASVSKTDVS